MEKTFMDKILDLRKEALPVLRLNEQKQIQLASTVIAMFGEKIREEEQNKKQKVDLYYHIDHHIQFVKDIIKDIVKDDSCKICVSSLSYVASPPFHDEVTKINHPGFIEQTFLFSLEYSDCIIECLKVAINTNIRGLGEVETFVSDIHFLPAISQTFNIDMEEQK